MKIKNNSFVKILSVLCATVLLMTALFANPTIISALNDGSDDSVVNKGDIFATPKNYGFEPSENPVTDKTVASGSLNMTRGGDRLAVMGLAWDVVDSDAQHGKVLLAHNENMSDNKAISGGYRINNDDGVYRLEKNSTYIVEMEVNLTSAHTVGDAASVSKVYLGYGSKDSNISDTNGIDTMTNCLLEVVNVGKDATQYTVNSTEKTAVYDVNSGWHTVKYVFTSPADFGNINNALSLYASLMPGAKIEIDNISVKKLGEDEGIIVFTDDFHGNSTVYLDDIDNDVELPVLIPENPEHTFEGWYTEYDRADDTKVADGYKMVGSVTTLYARFKAPVSIVFNNTLTGTAETVTGVPGDKIPYPDFPTDDSLWFAGWFTTTSYTEEYVVENFPYANITLYSKWVQPSASAIEDFDTYTSDAWENKETASGQIIKSNAMYFGRMCSISDFAYGDGGKSWKYTWDKEMELDSLNPETYDSKRFKDYDSSTLLEDVALDNNTTYLVSFKYYAEQISTTLNVVFNTAAKNNTWGNRGAINNEGSIFNITPNMNDGKWHEAYAVIKTNFNGAGISIFINVTMNQNSDAVLYIDDVAFTPIKPTDSYAMYDFGVENKFYVGGIGTTLPHLQDGAADELTKYKWCTDDFYSTEYKGTVFEREPFSVYAKAPITFNNDSAYSTNAITAMNKGNTVEIINKEGIGNGDDYALEITYEGDVYVRTDDKTGKDIYYRDRYNMYDFQALARTGLRNNKVLLITYDIKTEATTLDYSVIFTTAMPENIWGGLGLSTPTSTTISRESVGDGWVRQTTAIKTAENLSYGNALFLVVQFAHSLEGQSAKIYIDNLLVEEVTAPIAVFDSANGKAPVVLKGEAGSSINIPAAPTKVGYDFTGWYTDAKATEKFTATTFSDSEIYYAYAGYTAAKTVVFDYEEYYVPYAVPGNFQRSDAWAVKVPFAYSGDFVMMADRSTVRHPDLNGGGGAHRLMNGNIDKGLSKDKNYLITFKYYIETHGQSPLRVRASAAMSINLWAGVQISNTYDIALDEQTGVWHTGTLVCNGSKITGDHLNTLYLGWFQGNEGLYYIDDVSVTELEDGQMAYFIDNGGCSGIPEYVIGREGESFASQLPKNPKYANHQFLGYFVLGDDGKYQEFTDMKFYADKTPAIIARFIRLKTVQDFETYYAPAIAAMSGYSVLDYDYELYDALAKGNTRDNVTSGRYSLHRLGKSHYFENALLLTQAQQLTAGEKYTVTFKVKMPSYLQTDGAIKLVSCNSPIFAWATMGDYYPVAAVKDLTDGQWYELSYTFIAIEPFVSIQTPGYCELYIDDVVFTHVSADTEVSVPVTFTEYVPAKRDLATGEIITTVTEVGNVDVSTIIDDTLVEGNFGSSSNIIVIIISAVAAVVVLAAVVIILLVLKKKKKA